MATQPSLERRVLELEREARDARSALALSHALGIQDAFTSRSYRAPDEYLFRICVSDAQEGSTGTALQLTTDGYFLTAYHVIEGVKEGRRWAMVAPSRAPVGRVFTWKEHDLAIFKAPLGWPPAPTPVRLSDAAAGGAIRLIGMPKTGWYCAKGEIVETGYRSSMEFSDGRIPLCDRLRTSAQSVPGSSGGAYVDDAGRLVGRGWEAL